MNLLGKTFFSFPKIHKQQHLIHISHQLLGSQWMGGGGLKLELHILMRICLQFGKVFGSAAQRLMKLWKATNENFLLSIMKPLPTHSNTLYRGMEGREEENRQQPL